MKHFIAMLLAFSMIWLLSACGSSAAPASSGEQSTAVSSAESSVQEVNTITVDMIYSGKCENKENSITAFCYTDEGVDLLGGDDYVVNLEEAKLYDAQGKEITVDDLTVGCPIQVQCEDQVYASQPPLLHALSVKVLSDEPVEGYEKATVDMIYFKNLGGGSIMAACYTDEGVSLLGADYYVVHVGDATIYNTAGQEIILEELPRGSELRIQWPGMVMESYPGQIAAETVTVLSDDIPADFPAENEIPPINDGPIWWEKPTATEAPNLVLDYSSELALATMAIQPHSAQWSYSEGDSAGANNGGLSGQPVQEWTFDGNNTLKRAGFDIITLSARPAPDAITVTAFAYGDESDQGTVLELDGEGNLTLLDGKFIYLVEAKWDNATYVGQAVYACLVLDEETP